MPKNISRRRFLTSVLNVLLGILLQTARPETGTESLYFEVRLDSCHIAVLAPDQQATGTAEAGSAWSGREVQGMSLIRRQFYALLVKRFHHFRRSKKGFFAQVKSFIEEVLEVRLILQTGLS